MPSSFIVMPATVFAVACNIYSIISRLLLTCIHVHWSGLVVYIVEHGGESSHSPCKIFLEANAPYSFQGLIYKIFKKHFPMKKNSCRDYASFPHRGLPVFHDIAAWSASDIGQFSMYRVMQNNFSE